MINIIERKLSSGRTTNIPKMIVVHSMAEYLDLPDGPMFAPDYLEREGLSAHALIIPNGDVMMCRRESQGAYHAKGFNKNSLGVEFLVSGVHNYQSFIDHIKTDYVTKEQYIAGIDLIKSWLSGYGIDRIVRHSDISPERKVDPGDGFKWEWFKKQLTITKD